MIGKPLNRIDGPLKVSGRATYAYEEWGLGQPLYGHIVGSTIGRGRIDAMDITRAEHAPGVQRVFTHANAPLQGEPDMKVPSVYSRALPVLSSRQVSTFGDPVALVVADTLEQARAAAALVDVTYEVEEGFFDLVTRKDHAHKPDYINAFLPVDTAVGDFDAGFGGAPIQLDQLYTNPYTFSQPMELHAALATWDGELLTIHATTQIVSEGRKRIAATFGLQPEQIRILSPYVGGGFGSKLGLHAETILAAMAALELRRPVKVSATRQQVFHIVGNRPASRQRVRLGGEHDGRLIAFAHDVVQKMSTGSDWVEQTATTGRALYAAPNRRTTHRGVPLDLPVGEDVRAPGEAPGMLAIETAMDELAVMLDIDPVELRIRDEPASHPELGIPFSQRRLVECMSEGARRFGWDKRPTVPASLVDGRSLVGYGMAAAIRPHFQSNATVRVRLDRDGTAIVQSDMTDIGTGTYTILAQTASDALGIPVDRVCVQLADSEFPESAGSGGSWGAANSCTALFRACRALREKVLAGVGDEERAAADNLAKLVARNFPDGVEATGSIGTMDEEPNFKSYSMNTYGAYFAEVHVDLDTAEIRLHRMLGVFDPGRVFNPKTARSQLLGGMIWGVAMALHEEGVVDTRMGAFINHDLAQYLVPVHADVPNVEAIILDGFDDKANELGAKGLGELGICGSGAAIGNAVYNATGVRVRDFPITIEKILQRMHPS